MATPIAIPRLGMAVTDATVVEWAVKEGEWVKEQQVVVVIETEKIRYDVEAPVAGFIHILVEEGNTAPVGMMIGLLAESKEELEALQKEPPKETITTVAEEVEAPGVEAIPPKVAVAAEREEERIRISPVARKIAEEHAIDITKIVGTGPGGRIVREDVEKATAAKEEAPTVTVYEGKRVKATIC